ncbi:hypothetical protein [Enterobacter ludwigii]|uniref:hypothetical protein n=1 Tax=Enterobacter ludwigii TaxID=299767 RepID=UPI003A808029
MQQATNGIKNFGEKIAVVLVQTRPPKPAQPPNENDEREYMPWKAKQVEFGGNFWEGMDLGRIKGRLNVH